MKVWDYLPEFVEALQEQLESDEKRWGDTWRKTDIGTHEERITFNIWNYFDQYRYGGTPIPWLKIAGLALIAWIRDNHPEIFSE